MSNGGCGGGGGGVLDGGCSRGGASVGASAVAAADDGCRLMGSTGTTKVMGIAGTRTMSSKVLSFFFFFFPLDLPPLMDGFLFRVFTLCYPFSGKSLPLNLPGRRKLDISIVSAQ